MWSQTGSDTVERSYSGSGKSLAGQPVEQENRGDRGKEEGATARIPEGGGEEETKVFERLLISGWS